MCLLFAANKDNESEDSSVDSDSDTDRAATRHGGYSFETGQRLTIEEQTDSDSGSLALESKATRELISESDTSSAEIPYQPGFVSKLLNKWSRINDTSESNSVTENLHVTSTTTSNHKASSLSHSNGVTVTKPESTTVYNSKSDASKEKLVQRITSSSDMFSKVESTAAVTEPKSRSAERTPITHNAEESRNRRPSFRNPEEIVLIEAESPRDCAAEEQKTLSPLHSVR